MPNTMLLLLAAILQLPPASARTVLVAYYSEGGHTLEMAEAVARGAAEVPGTTVWLRAVDSVRTNELLSADAIIIGSPVYNANPAPEVLQFIKSWPFRDAPMRNKIGAAFVSAGGISAGEETVQLALLRAMLVFGMLVTGGDDWTSAFGASAIHEEAPFLPQQENDGLKPAFISKAEALGRRVAGLAALLCEADHRDEARKKRLH